MKKLTGRLVPSALMLALMGGCIVAIWLRNHDILRDLYDYSIVIAAAGKIEAGLRPYSDVRSHGKPNCANRSNAVSRKIFNQTG